MMWYGVVIDRSTVPEHHTNDVFKSDDCTRDLDQYRINCVEVNLCECDALLFTVSKVLYGHYNINFRGISKVISL